METRAKCHWCETSLVWKRGSTYCLKCRPIAKKVLNNARKAENLAFRTELLASLGCKDCGLTDPRKLRIFGQKQIGLTHSKEAIFRHVVEGVIRCHSCQAKYTKFGHEYKHEPGLPKPCSKCGIVKELDEFSPEKRTKNGRHSWCHVCQREGRRKKV